MKHRLALARGRRARGRRTGLRGGRTNDDHDERLDLGRAARGQARQGLRQEAPRQAPVQALRRAARTSASPTSPHGRVTIGNSSRDPKPTDPGRPRLQQDRARRDLPRHQPEQPDREPLAGAGPGRSSPAGSATGARSRAPSVTGPIDLIVRTAASGTQDAFQKHLHGSDLRGRARAQPRRRPTASCSSRSRPTRTRSATCRSTSPRACTRCPYKGVACNLRNAKSGQYGGRRATSGWSRAASRRARRASSIQLDPVAARRRRSSPRTGCRCT